MHIAEYRLQWVWLRAAVKCGQKRKINPYECWDKGVLLSSAYDYHYICVSISQRANEAPVSGLRQPTPYFQRGKTSGVDAHTPLAPAQHSGICQRSWMGCLCLLVPACTLSWPLSTCCLAWFVYHQADPLPFKEEGSTSGNAPCYCRSAEEPQSALLWPVSYKYPLISETVVNKYGHKYFI